MASSLKELLSQNTMPSAAELVIDEGAGVVRCVACGHRCRIAPGKAGVCRVRFNEDGQLRVPAHYVAGLQVDPIEKKPFYHAYPGRNALSFGMLGCDLHCSYCQNWVSSQTLRDDDAVARPTFIEPERLVSLAVEHGAPVMVSTYNEPLITADWAMEVFRLAREQGIVCGFVSNGNATSEVLSYIRPCVDLYKVDLKCFNDRNYRRLGGTLRNILDSIGRLVEMGFWVEVVTLVVPGFNDSDEELTQIARFLVGLSADIPWHVTAFHPDYKMTDPPRTPVATLLRAYDIGRSAGLKFVYPGNSPGSVGDREHTYCPNCSELLIRRYGFYVQENRMSDGKCPGCGTRIPGVWEPDPPRKSNNSGRPLPVRM
ncbi:MAG TPA: AmmeMemoRadiSam system radical SAM enzyme [Phycisphaerae bacterium]|nr:AmmeMemoRadiSam system radical SAM enzyme [Phycisphaerae bacterium]HOJ74744.1 AmmeMemoRadiSam system radical SAM enzyme [Phycisphaerae bacterium]HOM52113.1 AmmeMemoRadiSam system radical SAM enzyme [Phycisphaerae bacterium]HON66867.1 AmmeMemoRadiSam system radical SAM enzyme [Phycisphaerae bacterium]HPP27640.1 AmmeMemoRadiSam system radical SAM enzyme [Phycisphaerae bacterium]